MCQHHVSVPRCADIMCQNIQMFQHHESKYPDVPTFCVRALRYASIMCHSTQICRHNVSDRALRCASIMCHSTQMCRHHVSEHSDMPASCVIVLRSADIVSEYSDVLASLVTTPGCSEITYRSAQICHLNKWYHQDVPKFPVNVSNVTRFNSLTLNQFTSSQQKSIN